MKAPSPAREPDSTTATHIGMAIARPKANRLNRIGRVSINPSTKPSDISARNAKWLWLMNCAKPTRARTCRHPAEEPQEKTTTRLEGLSHETETPNY